MAADDEAHSREAEIWWWGNSKEILSDFPSGVKRNLGFALRMLQSGDEPPHYRHLKVFGAGVYELREQDEQAWYRVVYLSRVGGVIHVYMHSRRRVERFHRTM